MQRMWFSIYFLARSHFTCCFLHQSLILFHKLHPPPMISPTTRMNSDGANLKPTKGNKTLLDHVPGRKRREDTPAGSIPRCSSSLYKSYQTCSQTSKVFLKGGVRLAPYKHFIWNDCDYFMRCIWRTWTTMQPFPFAPPFFTLLSFSNLICDLFCI